MYTTTQKPPSGTVSAGYFKFTIFSRLFIMEVMFMFAATDAGDWPRQDADPKHFYEARIELKKLVSLLAGQQVNPVKVICSK